jgi:hypothetical protein
MASVLLACLAVLALLHRPQVIEEDDLRFLACLGYAFGNLLGDPASETALTRRCTTTIILMGT